MRRRSSGKKIHREMTTRCWRWRRRKQDYISDSVEAAQSRHKVMFITAVMRRPVYDHEFRRTMMLGPSCREIRSERHNPHLPHQRHLQARRIARLTVRDKPA
jgi:hypothetical protein